MSVEETKLNRSVGVRNTVSTSSERWRFMVASWNSNSKSDTARRPRTIAFNPCFRANSTVRPE
jgi:hypothetical protein